MSVACRAGGERSSDRVSGRIISCYDDPVVAGCLFRKMSEKVQANTKESFGRYGNRLKESSKERGRSFSALAFLARGDVTLKGTGETASKEAAPNTVVRAGYAEERSN